MEAFRPSTRDVDLFALCKKSSLDQELRVSVDALRRQMVESKFEDASVISSYLESWLLVVQHAEEAPWSVDAEDSELLGFLWFNLMEPPHDDFIFVRCLHFETVNVAAAGVICNIVFSTSVPPLEAAAAALAFAEKALEALRTWKNLVPKLVTLCPVCSEKKWSVAEGALRLALEAAVDDPLDEIEHAEKCQAFCKTHVQEGSFVVPVLNMLAELSSVRQVDALIQTAETLRKDRETVLVAKSALEKAKYIAESLSNGEEQKRKAEEHLQTVNFLIQELRLTGSQVFSVASERARRRANGVV